MNLQNCVKLPQSFLTNVANLACGVRSVQELMKATVVPLHLLGFVVGLAIKRAVF